MSGEAVSMCELTTPRSCTNCDAEGSIRWLVQGFMSVTFPGRPRVSAFLGCGSCGETTSLIEYAEDQLGLMADTATSDPVRALSAAWDAIVPQMRPRSLAEMGEDDPVDLSRLQAVLGELEPVDLLCISVVATRLAEEAHRVRDARMMAELKAARAEPRAPKVYGLIIKPVREVDEYVAWSTMNESPHFVGTAEQVLEFVGPGEGFNDTRTRLARADETGTSSQIGEGRYGTSLIFEQRGFIACEQLGQLATLVLAGKLQDALRLCEPFDDENRVRGLEDDGGTA